jgi:hypothetical protein
MREPLERLLSGLDDRQQKILLGVLVERLLRDETEEIVFEDSDGTPIGYFLPHDLRMELDHARFIAQIDHPNGLPSNDYVLARMGISKQG